MSEMVDRVTTVLKTFNVADITPTGNLMLRWEEMARAAIAAMREPTEAMIDAALDKDFPSRCEVWEIMIDEALR